jgi:hypothetical protein
VYSYTSRTSPRSFSKSIHYKIYLLFICNSGVCANLSQYWRKLPRQIYRIIKYTVNISHKSRTSMDNNKKDFFYRNLTENKVKKICTFFFFYMDTKLELFVYLFAFETSSCGKRQWSSYSRGTDRWQWWMILLFYWNKIIVIWMRSSS